MKKFVSFLLIIAIFISLGAPTFANMEEKISNHWSKTLIKKDFLIYYFPYLAKENFNRFDPKEVIYEDEFLLSFSSLLKDYGYTNAPIGLKTELTRGDMAKLIGEKLVEIGLISDIEKSLPFTDIQNLSTERKKAIANLYYTNILKGQSSTIYNPNKKLTQGEAIIVLQRINDLLYKGSNIPFKLSGVVEYYSGTEGVNWKSEGDKILVTITKMLPTPGYSVEVKEILKSKGAYNIHLNITPPPKDSEQLQVITYKIITIEIDKKDLGDPPYNFVLEDFFIK